MKKKLLLSLFVLSFFGNCLCQTPQLKASLLECDKKVMEWQKWGDVIEKNFIKAQDYSFKVEKELSVCNTSDSTKSVLIKRLDARVVSISTEMSGIMDQFDKQQEIINDQSSLVNKYKKKVNRRNKVIFLETVLGVFGGFLTYYFYVL